MAVRSARVEHLIRFLKCPIKIADTFRPYFFGIPYKSRAVIPHAIAASSWAAAVDFATQARRPSTESGLRLLGRQAGRGWRGRGLWVRFSVLALSLALFAIRKFFLFFLFSAMVGSHCIGFV